MSDAPARAEFEALAALVAAQGRHLAEVSEGLQGAIQQTGCTDPENNRRDRALRDRQAYRESVEGRLFENDLRDMVEDHRRRKAARDDARQWWVDLGVKTGVYSAVFGLAAGFLSGAAWVVLSVVRWVNGGAP